jgi:hypothetical protein
MEIKPSEISDVDSLGIIDGEEVKLVRTNGGLYIAIAKLKNKDSQEVLAAGSHPAIVRYNIEKSFRNFQPSLMKSESEMQEFVSGMSELLPEDMQNKGYDFYVIKKSNQVDMVLTKSNIEILKYEGSLLSDELVVGKPNKMLTKDTVKVAKAATIASAIIAVEEGKSSIVHENNRYNAKSVLEKL